MTLDLGVILIVGLVCAIASLLLGRPRKNREADGASSSGSPHPAVL